MIFKRRRRHHPEAVRPDPRRLAEAQEEAEKAHTQLDNAQAQDEEVDERSERLTEILAKNNLGPAFWAAVAARRSQ